MKIMMSMIARCHLRQASSLSLVLKRAGLILIILFITTIMLHVLSSQVNAGLVWHLSLERRVGFGKVWKCEGGGHRGRVWQRSHRQSINALQLRFYHILSCFGWEQPPSLNSCAAAGLGW